MKQLYEFIEETFHIDLSQSKFTINVTNVKNGSRPKSENTLETYEPSVYLFSEYLYLLDKDNFNSVDTEIYNLIDQLRDKLNNYEQYSVFEIKFKNKNIELHQDPTYDYGCFVHRLILPNEINLIKHY